MRRKHDKRYMELRVLMLKQGMDEDAIALACGRSRATISRRMSGMLDWPMEDAYKVLDALKAPADQLSVVFPRRGLA